MMIQPQRRNRKTVILATQGLQKLAAAKLKINPWNSSTRACTLEALSEYTGLSSHTLNKIHTGKTGVDLRTLVRYFSAFKLTLEPDDYRLLRSEESESQSHKQDELWPLDRILSGVSVTKTLRPATAWGMAPEVVGFCGYSTELETLQQWISNKHCRLITLLGMEGIGKTWLAAKLAEQIQHEFKIVIWRSLRPISRSRAPLPFNAFLDGLIRHLNPHPRSETAEPIAARVEQLIDLLKHIPCLLVLDNIESVLQRPATFSSPVNSSIQQDDYEAYESLLKHLGQGRHQSRIILTSRTEPQPLRFMENTSGIRFLTLPGLKVGDIQPIFKDKGRFQEASTHWSRLVDYYSGNPMILGIVARTIQRLFNGSIAEFLHQDTLLFNDLREFLAQQLKNISEPEQAIMNALAIQDLPLSCSDLRSHVSSSVPTLDLLEVLKSLEVRSLIERQSDRLFLRPLFKDYLKEKFALRAFL